MINRRIVILVGHYGSGKTELALHLALTRARMGEPCVLADLDVVKPYFRTRGARSILEAAGVRLIAPQGANIFADMPVLMPQLRGVCADPTTFALLDAGGDDAGARVLGAVRDVIPEDEAQLLLVLNFRRPSTPDVQSAVLMAKQIEATARLRLSGVISNTHLMSETTALVVEEGYKLALETSRQLGIPLLAVTVEDRVLATIDTAAYDVPVVAIQRIVRPPFEQPTVPHSGPLFSVA